MNDLISSNSLNLTSLQSTKDLLLFVLAIILSITFSYLLRYFYLNYWRSLSDKNQISSNFVLLTLIITIIITVVKSSLALSLGLVGALSIVRFRTPIKDPEELIFLFICIAMGLALGAFQFWFAAIGFFFVIIVILFKSKFNKDISQNNFFISINSKAFDVQKFIDGSNDIFESVILKKIEETDNFREIIFNMKLKKNVSFKELETYLKSNGIKDYTYFDQDNFFQN
ncbi:DUF4956 domain-containing protein [Candidatus Pelagibacter sp.]|uniref:DUF4956 domain-containing protein n=1 Tax=Candidatus Pelagibacter sp. TaxID=2024849 RepID=UPI003F867D0F